MPRPSELLRQMVRELKEGKRPDALRELGRWLDNINGQTDPITQMIGGGSGAPVNATYLTISAEPGLLFERALSATAPIVATDNGPNSTLVVSISAATPAADGSMSAADKSKLDGIEAGANLYVHPNHSGDVTSAGDGAQTIASGAVTLGKMANLAALTIIGNDHPTDALTPQALTVAEARTLLIDNKGHRAAVAIKSGDYTLTTADEVVVFTATATATLPAATGSGQTYRLVCRSGTLTVDADGSETIVGELTQTLEAGDDLIVTDTAAGVWE